MIRLPVPLRINIQLNKVSFCHAADRFGAVMSVAGLIRVGSGRRVCSQQGDITPSCRCSAAGWRFPVGYLERSADGADVGGFFGASLVSLSPPSRQDDITFLHEGALPHRCSLSMVDCWLDIWPDVTTAVSQKCHRAKTERHTHANVLVYCRINTSAHILSPSRLFSWACFVHLNIL